MEYKLLSVSKHCNQINIGDYVQALASSQFLPSIDGFVDRDYDLQDLDGVPCKIIMNGWYMSHPENWPPSDRFSPLFVAFHINSKYADKLLSKKSLEYLKQHEPIGCRDTFTLELLRERGIDAYFSGCMTLTLGKNYKADAHNDEIYFVDPLVENNVTIKARLTIFAFMAMHFATVSKMARHYHFSGKGYIKRLYHATQVYKTYRCVLAKSLLKKAHYIFQMSNEYVDKYPTDMARLNVAEELIKKYATAKFVITSRIHCALPCIGMETPVIFIDGTASSVDSACRLGGLKDFFKYVILYDRGRLLPQFEVKNKIDIESSFDLPLSWKGYAESLEKRCIQFINNTLSL